MRLLISTSLLLISVSIGGCATDKCAGWEPINPSRKDVLTEGTTKQIIAHDEFGAKQGCWR